VARENLHAHGSCVQSGKHWTAKSPQDQFGTVSLFQVAVFFISAGSHSLMEGWQRVATSDLVVLLDLLSTYRF
jgi:hypothetical protein